MSRRSIWFLSILHYLTSVAFVTCLSFSDNAFTSDEKENIVLYRGGWTPALHQYQSEILSHALNTTYDKFGDFKISYFDREVSMARMQYELSNGHLFHTEFATGKNYYDGIIQIQIPLFGGILGFRNLIIPSSRQYEFAQIKNKHDIQQYTVGQVIDWSDINIYESAGIQVIKPLKYENLFRMLRFGRFDYTALGIVEATEALRQEREYRDKLKIVDDLYVFYPIPTYINISKKHSNLVERIRYGFNNIISNGTLQRLFHKHLNQYISTFHPEKSKVLVFNNPELSEQENSEEIRNAMALLSIHRDSLIDMRSNAMSFIAE